MAGIVCATRGGEGSRAVQRAAIERARETGQPVCFLYVIDSSLLERIDEPMRSFVRVELYWLAKTLLRIAENRAQAAGLNPELVIREGRVAEEITSFVKSTNASSLLLGASRQEYYNAFGVEEIVEFARSIQQATGVQVVIIRPPWNERQD